MLSYWWSSCGIRMHGQEVSGVFRMPAQQAVFKRHPTAWRGAKEYGQKYKNTPIN